MSGSKVLSLDIDHVLHHSTQRITFPNITLGRPLYCMESYGLLWSIMLYMPCTIISCCRVPESMERWEQRSRTNNLSSDKVSENLSDDLSNDYDTLDKLFNDNHILDTLSNDHNILDKLANYYYILDKLSKEKG